MFPQPAASTRPSSAGSRRDSAAIQIFNQSPRMWRPTNYSDDDFAEFREAIDALADRVDDDPRRLPDQLREQGARDPREVDRLAHPRAAGRRRDRRRTASSCTPGPARASRTRASMKRAAKAIARGARRLRALPGAAREHRRDPGAAGARLRRARRAGRPARRRRAGRDLPRLLPPARLRIRDPHPRGARRRSSTSSTPRSGSTGCAACTSTTRRSRSAATATATRTSARARSASAGSASSSPSRGSTTCRP